MGLVNLKHWLCLILLTAVATFVQAQSLGENRPDTSKWSYEVNLSASGRLITGTFDQFVFSPRLDVEVASKRWQLENTTNYHYNSTNGQTIEDNWFELLTLSYFVRGDKLFPMAFYNYENNLMFRVKSRHLGGLGLSTQNKWKRGFARLDLGAGYENTVFNGENFENSGLVGSQREKELFMFRVVHQHQMLGGRMAFSNVIFYRHSLKESQDFFIRMAPGATFKIAKGLSASINYIYRFEKVHLKNLSDTNTALVFGLSYKIKNG